MDHKMLGNCSLALSCAVLLGVGGFRLNNESNKASLEEQRNAIVVGASKFVAGNSYRRTEDISSTDVYVDPALSIKVLQGGDGRYMVMTPGGKVSSIIDKEQMDAAVTDRLKEIEIKKKEKEEAK